MINMRQVVENTQKYSGAYLKSGCTVGANSTFYQELQSGKRQ